MKDRRRRALPVPSERRTQSERREHERVLVNFQVDYRCNDTFLFAYITDLSAMGIFVQTQTPHPEGTQINLRFSPTGGAAEIDVEGRVIWVNKPRADGENRNPGMGIQFVDLTPMQREQILGLIRTFAYLPDDDDVIMGNS